MDWRALGAAVVRRRVELGFDHRKDFAKAKRLGERNLSDVEHGRRESYDPAYLVRLERALHWPPGTVDAVLAGRQPPADLTPPPMLPGLAGDEPPDALQLRLNRLRAVYDLLPYDLQEWLIALLDVTGDRAEERLNEALEGRTRPRTAAELLELAEDLDEDQRQQLLAIVEYLKDGRRYPGPAEVRLRR